MGIFGLRSEGEHGSGSPRFRWSGSWVGSRPSAANVGDGETGQLAGMFHFSGKGFFAIIGFQFPSQQVCALSSAG